VLGPIPFRSIINNFGIHRAYKQLYGNECLTIGFTTLTTHLTKTQNLSQGRQRSSVLVAGTNLWVSLEPHC